MLWRYRENMERLCRALLGARGWRVRVTQGSLRVALGYILSPPWEAGSAVRQVFDGGRSRQMSCRATAGLYSVVSLGGWSEVFARSELLIYRLYQG